MSETVFSETLTKLIDRTKKKFTPPEDINTWQWADKYRFLPAGTSARPGWYESSFTPYWREVMEAFNDPRVQTVVVKAAAQTAKTDIFTNYCGYRAHIRPTHIYIVLPDEKTYADFSTNKLQPMFDSSPALQGLLRDSAPGKVGSTERRKLFPGGSITFATANSPADMRSRSVEVGIIDELDAIPRGIANEGSIVTLLENRTNTYEATRKLIYVSTPTDEMSQIEELYLNGDQCKYFVPCPHCGHMQTLEFEQLQIPRDADGKFETEKAMYACSGPDCGALWTTQEKDEAVTKGRWIATEDKPVDPRCRSFELTGLVSPMHTFEGVAARWAKSHKDPEKKKAFWNTVLGRVWLENLTKPDHVKLRERSEPYDPSTLITPKDVLLIVASVDVQHDRLALSIWGYGKGQQSWLLYFDELEGNPLKEDVWNKLDAILGTEFKRGSADGAPLKIEACGIDSRDFTTKQAVFQFCRERLSRNIFPVQGNNDTWGNFISSRPKKHDIDVNGNIIKEGIDVWMLSTASIKEFLYARLKLEEVGPGYVHTYKTARDDFWKQLTAETLKVTMTRGGKKKREWVKPTHLRNEALDTMVYAYAAALRCGIDQPGYFERREIDILDWELTHKNTTKTVENEASNKKAGKTITRSTGGLVNMGNLPINQFGNREFKTTDTFELEASNNFITNWK